MSHFFISAMAFRSRDILRDLVIWDILRSHKNKHKIKQRIKINKYRTTINKNPLKEHLYEECQEHEHQSSRQQK